MTEFRSTKTNAVKKTAMEYVNELKLLGIDIEWLSVDDNYNITYIKTKDNTKDSQILSKYPDMEKIIQ